MGLRFKQAWGLVILLVLILTYVAISLFDSKASGSSVKEIYFADRITAAHKILIEKYNELHKGKIKVIPIDFPNSDFSTNERKELVARSLRGRGDGIDLFAVDVIWVERFARWAEPLDKYFSAEEKSQILNMAMKSCYYNGKLVAIPLDIAQGIMYYREDLIKKMKNGNQIIKELRNNITWSQFIKLKYAMNLKNPFYTFTGADYEGMVCLFVEQLLSLNPNYFQQNGFNFETKDAERTLQLFVDLINKYDMSPSVVTHFTEPPSYSYFINNNGVFLHGWQTYDKDFQDSHFNVARQDDLSKALPPHFKDGSPTSIVGGWDLMVSKFSDKKPEVINFVKFLLSNDSQEIFYEKSALFPVKKAFYDDSTYLKKYPELKDAKALIERGVHRPANVEYTKFSKIMSFYFNKAMKKEISVNEALKKCTRDIQSDRLMP
jgi:multiple sugar transport system substrate-binding protein